MSSIDVASKPPSANSRSPTSASSACVVTGRRPTRGGTVAACTGLSPSHLHWVPLRSPHPTPYARRTPMALPLTVEPVEPVEPVERVEPVGTDPRDEVVAVIEAEDEEAVEDLI